MKITIKRSTVELLQGDITEQDTDAVVNAANTTLTGGGGVDGAIHKAGGPKILEEAKKLAPCPVGEARLTTGGNLKAKYVIHTVGPVYKDGRHNEAKLLEKSYRSSLELASKHKIRSLAFPSISTGAYRYPVEEAARIALSTVGAYLLQHPEIEQVRFVLFDEKTYRIYQRTLEELSVGE
ncbi:MAG: O-acetyl-ADP-ribose deacetylase [Nitrospirota bacterium]